MTSLPPYWGRKTSDVTGYRLGKFYHVSEETTELLLQLQAIFSKNSKQHNYCYRYMPFILGDRVGKKTHAQNVKTNETRKVLSSV